MSALEFEPKTFRCAGWCSSQLSYSGRRCTALTDLTYGFIQSYCLKVLKRKTLTCDLFNMVTHLLFVLLTSSTAVQFLTQATQDEIQRIRSSTLTKKKARDQAIAERTGATAADSKSQQGGERWKDSHSYYLQPRRARNQMHGE